MVILIDGFRVQVDPLLVNKPLEPLLEGDVVLDNMTHIPVIWAEQGIISHPHLIGPPWFWKI
jgi:hypothetical protein